MTQPNSVLGVSMEVLSVIYCMPGTVSGTWDSLVIKTENHPCPCGV